MLMDDLKTTVDEAKRKKLTGPLIMILLKEVLQYYLLSYLYSSSYGKKLIFTGGSCLRICYGLNRLSEDLDFDILPSDDINKKQLTDDIIQYFRKVLQYKEIEANIAGRGGKIYFKFPVLANLGLAEKKGKRQKLFVKVEIEENPSMNYQTDLTPVAKYNFNFLVLSYDLPNLMTNKIAAILSRTWQKGKTKITFKGRDYYDLFWFLQKRIEPNMKRLKSLTGIKSKKELNEQLKNKINLIKISYLKEDLIDLFEDSKFVDDISANYKTLVKKYLERN